MCASHRHALIAARQWIPPSRSRPGALASWACRDLVFRTKGQLAIDLLTETLTGGTTLDFVCGDEVYGSCTQLREFCNTPARDMCCEFPPASASRWRAVSP